MSDNTCPICLERCSQRFVERKWEYSIYECSNCTAQYSVPLKSDHTDKRIRKGYRRRLELVGNYIGWAHREFLKHDIKTGGRVLEIGCGTGDFIFLANKQGYNAIGVDLDKDAVLVGRTHWKMDFIFPMHAEEYFLQQGRKRFDIVCLFAVLEHLSNPHFFFKEIKKYLNIGGYVILEVPNNDSFLTKLYRKVTRVIDYPPQHLLRWNKKSLEIFLELHGFEVVMRKTCEPTITDIIPDLYKIDSPAFLKTATVMRLSGLTCKILSPLDFVVKRFVKEGRSLLVIARLAEKEEK